MKRTILSGAVATVVVLFAAALAVAHITPPVVLVSDREAVASLLAGSRRFFVREVRLSPEQRQRIQKQSGWTPEEDFYRFYIGRDDQGRMVAATIFLTEFTLHGPVRVAVALSPDGKVRGAAVVELTEETYPWVKPLIDQNFTGGFVGQGGAGTTAATDGRRAGDAMSHFYGEVIATLIKRAAVLFDVAVAGQGSA
jgi:Na+-translocating ferredoxin:NAD+ oxidoreductase RnfG subunit